MASKRRLRLQSRLASLVDASRPGAGVLPSIENLRSTLEQRFGIDHATLELECHPCAEPGESLVEHHSHPQ